MRLTTNSSTIIRDFKSNRNQLIAFIIVIVGLVLFVKFIVHPYYLKKEKQLVEAVQQNPIWTDGVISNIRIAKNNSYVEFIYSNEFGSIFTIEENAPTNLNGNTNYVVVYNRTDPSLAYVRWDKPLFPVNSKPKLTRCLVDETELRDYGFIHYVELDCRCIFDGRKIEFSTYSDISYLDGRDSVWVEYLNEKIFRIYDSIEPMYFGIVNGQPAVKLDWIH